MTTRQLTVHNASVTTMTVEVKTLTIGARQVTQGIFRQLIEEPLIAEDGTLKGTPWGHVTWHPDGCSAADEHWHIVWHRADQLRRARVNAVPDFEWKQDQRNFECDDADRFLDAWIREACHGRANQAILAEPEHRKDPFGRILGEPVNRETKVPVRADMSTTAHDAATCHGRTQIALKAVETPLTLSDTRRIPGNEYDEWASAHPQADSALRAAIGSDVKVSLARGADGDFDVRILARSSTAELGKAVRAEAKAVLELLVQKRDWAMKSLIEAAQKEREAVAALDAEVDSWELTWPEIKAQYEAAVRTEAARRQRHRDVRAELARLPQLFIGG